MITDLNDVEALKYEIERIRILLDISVDNGKTLKYSTIYNDQIDDLIAAYISLQEKNNQKSATKNR